LARDRGGDAGVTSAGEPEVCPRCGHGLAYARRTISHLGSARCARCSWATARPDVLVEIRGLSALDAMSLRLGDVELDLAVGGLHNAYNVAAAAAAASTLGIAVRDAA